MRRVFGKLSGMVVVAVMLACQSVAQAEAKGGDRFGDWVLECPALAGKTVCLLSQTVVAAKDQRRIVKFSIHKGAPATESTLTVLLPLGIHLPAGATVTITPGGKEAPRQLPLTLQTCTPQGCIANTRMDLALLKGASKLGVSFTARPGTAPVAFNGSTKGLADGLAGLHE